MPFETEIKILLGSDEQLEKVLALCDAFFGPGKRSTQTDEYFDTPEESLKAADLTLRLRTIDRKLEVALKSPRVYLNNNVYKRIELEFSAANEAEVREQIKRQSLIPTAVIEKHRWEFITDDSKVLLDKLPFIGSFLEVEGSSPEVISEVVTKLMLSSYNSVRDNYTELLEAKLKKEGLPLRPSLRATFEAEAKWLSR